MSLHISFVQPTVTEAYMAEVFEDTFGASVAVQLTGVMKNQYNASYKMATIRITEPSRDLTRFMAQIRRHGSNTFYHRGCEAWTVKLNETAVARIV
jgi:hypothetical protein